MAEDNRHLENPETLEISSDAIEVGERAFADLGFLKTVSLPNAKIIGAGAFENCKSLREVVAADGARAHRSAFDGCGKLSKVIVGKIEYDVVMADGILMTKDAAYKNGRFAIFRGREILSRDGGEIKPDGKEFFLARRGRFSAHGGTEEKAVEDLEFKLSERRGMIKYRGANTDALGTRDDMRQAFRIITGACEQWVDAFIEEHRDVIPAELTLWNAACVIRVRGS